MAGKNLRGPKYIILEQLSRYEPFHIGDRFPSDSNINLLAKKSNAEIYFTSAVLLTISPPVGPIVIDWLGVSGGRFVIVVTTAGIVTRVFRQERQRYIFSLNVGFPILLQPSTDH